ncbi:hypothetical protein ACFXHA_10640 [Nocardia sp. NPDC059240]|uniref:hypothetical protein n=1 Tax=Nocardia sp. NPDC059240 TaxID=3346786 RepID=UPI003683C6F3
MSVNLDVQFRLYLRNREQADAAKLALDDFFEHELEGEVKTYCRENNKSSNCPWIVFGLSYDSIIISRGWLWAPRIEEDFRARVAAVAPDVPDFLVWFDVYDVDDERLNPTISSKLRRSLLAWLPKSDRSYFRGPAGACYRMLWQSLRSRFET